MLITVHKILPVFSIFVHILLESSMNDSESNEQVEKLKSRILYSRWQSTRVAVDGDLKRVIFHFFGMILNTALYNQYIKSLSFK